jgi:hypothetical protein
MPGLWHFLHCFGFLRLGLRSRRAGCRFRPCQCKRPAREVVKAAFHCSAPESNLVPRKTGFRARPEFAVCGNPGPPGTGFPCAVCSADLLCQSGLWRVCGARGFTRLKPRREAELFYRNTRRGDWGPDLGQKHGLLHGLDQQYEVRSTLRDKRDMPWVQSGGTNARHLPRTHARYCGQRNAASRRHFFGHGQFAWQHGIANGTQTSGDGS